MKRILIISFLIFITLFGYAYAQFGTKPFGRNPFATNGAFGTQPFNSGGGGNIPSGAIQDDSSHYLNDDAGHYLIAG